MKKIDPLPNRVSTASYSSISEALEAGNVFASQCPSRLILNHITSRWGVLVLVALLAGTHRFSELRRKITGVSERMLAQTLQVLEGDGFIDRRSLPVVPPHVEYNLTPLGVEVAEQVRSLVDWIEHNLGRINIPAVTEELAEEMAGEKAAVPAAGFV